MDSQSQGSEISYVSYENTRGGVFRKNDNYNHWNWVNEGSKHWKEAHGWSYFRLPDEFDFSSRYDTPQTMLDLSAEKDKDRQKLCMWDIQETIENKKGVKVLLLGTMSTCCQTQ